MYKEIKSITEGALVNMGPIQLRQPIPSSEFEQISPFILLHHFDFTMKPGESKFDVPAHPHRGFMPITFMYDGAVAHNDSLGNEQVIGDNEVQWISAGRGIIHSETAGKEWLAKGGRFHGIQLWINLAKEDKMKPASYQPITKEEIILIEEEGVKLRLVSGEYDGKKGPANSTVFTAMMEMEPDTTFTFNFPAGRNTIIYVLEGNVMVNNESTAQQHGLIRFNDSDKPILLAASAKTRLLVLSGEPINEPLVTHGPFVMNTQTEILEAMRDYEAGKMGYLY